MQKDSFHNWLQGTHVLVVAPEGQSKHARWASEAGATVTTLSGSLGSTPRVPPDLDAAVVHVGVGPGESLLTTLPPACDILLIADALDASACDLAARYNAPLLLDETPRADFLFELRRCTTLQVPDVSYLVGRAHKLWKLSPRQLRVLFYNLWSHSDREIAEAIGISVHTVQEHQNGLRRRTGVKTKHGYLRRIAEAAGIQPPLEDD